MSEQEGVDQQPRRSYGWTELVNKDSALRASYGHGPFQEAILPGDAKLRHGHVAIKIGQRVVRRKGVKTTIDTFVILSAMYLAELE